MVAIQNDTAGTGNGDRQWTYGGKPLYRGMMHKKPGDRAGDGYLGIEVDDALEMAEQTEV